MSASAISHEERVTETLGRFKVISNPTLRLIVTRGPVFIVLLLVTDALIGARLFAGDVFRVSSVLAATVEIVLFGALFAKVPEALRAIWTRNLIRTSVDGKAVALGFSQYLSEFASSLNSKYAWSAGAGLAILGLFSTYMVRAWLAYCSSAEKMNAYGSYCAEQFTLSKWLSYYLWGNWGIAGPLIGLLMGLLVWRTGVITLYMTRLSKHFILDVQFRHPDGTGGYRPFGDLCLLNALLIALPALFLSIWSFLPQIEAVQNAINLSVFNELWLDLFRTLLVVVLNVAAIWVFFGPAYGVHQQMKRRRDEALALLDDIGAGESTGKDSTAVTEWQSSLNRKRSQLWRELVESFSEEELNTLCFELGVDYENVSGDTKADKAREIVELFERENRLGELVDYCRGVRPEANWPDVTDLEQAARLIDMLPSPQQTLDSGYQALTRTPIWPFTNGVLLFVVSIQTVILGGLVSGIAASG